MKIVTATWRFQTYIQIFFQITYGVYASIYGPKAVQDVFTCQQHQFRS
jgi:hypothetical protein